MTTPANPITANDLAEALREAVKEQRWDAGECRKCYGAGKYWNEEQDREASCPECNGTGIAGDAAPRWQSLLDRYDAQRLSLALSQAISDRDAAMRLAAKYRDENDAKYVKAKVTIARAANHRALRLRRELRALDPTRHIAKDTE